MSCETDLADAKAARHALLTGKQMVRARYEGTDVQFTPADLPALERYIARLEAECGSPSGRGEPFGVIW